MNTEISIAVLGFLGTVLGSAFGVAAANRLTDYRLKQIDHKLELHNNAVERLYMVEQKITVMQETVKVANHRIADLEEFHK